MARIAIAFVLGMIAIASANGAEPKTFKVPLPAGWREAKAIRLVLEGVTIPADQAVKLRATLRKADAGAAHLGSAGIPAVRPADTHDHHLPTIRLDVTRNLKGEVDLPEKG